MFKNKILKFFWNAKYDPDFNNNKKQTDNNNNKQNNINKKHLFYLTFS